ncbi:MAG: PDDEXK nuclease domain-containing protein [Bacteroidota bacterium]|nr:PDDEXK nuclease domain-containing protein [Bacteroidota bacterium]
MIVAVNHELVKANWQIGKHIVEFEQKGNEKAEYGSELLSKLSCDLKAKHGKGFSKSSVYLSREFYIQYPIFQTLSGKLSWSHYTLLLSISENASREFYERSIEIENWSVRELQRQINASLYERIALSKNKGKMSLVKQKGKGISRYHHAVKDPYVLDFLGYKGKISEKKLEQALMDNLQAFLLELGKGFAFVGRQFKITVHNKHYSVDMVFYHRILKCFVLFDLKTRMVNHTDIGQMNWYLNYFKAEENVHDDNEPIGIILSPGKDEFLVEYALGGLSNKIFVSKYQLHLPEKKELKRQLEEFIEIGKKK